ncbi:hypothetical protein ABLE93_18515 [Xanthobacter sp. KR7-65]|uniref:hypothetical protein n=1 Tax=Xanthobacter sp. KR7-65 TaxID=3156612 RepID=UPI0032B3163A
MSSYWFAVYAVFYLADARLPLARHAREMLRTMEGTIEEMRYLSGKACGHLSVGFFRSLAHVVSVPWANTAQANHLKMRLQIAEGLSGHILSWIMQGKRESSVHPVRDQTAASR